jgi:hypothetical protein
MGIVKLAVEVPSVSTEGLHCVCRGGGGGKPYKKRPERVGGGGCSEGEHKERAVEVPSVCVWGGGGEEGKRSRGED